MILKSKATSRNLFVFIFFYWVVCQSVFLNIYQFETLSSIFLFKKNDISACVINTCTPGTLISPTDNQKDSRLGNIPTTGLGVRTLARL
jgi:hypothetical protein